MLKGITLGFLTAATVAVAQPIPSDHIDSTSALSPVVTDWGAPSHGVQARAFHPPTTKSGTDLGIRAQLRHCGTTDSMVVVSSVVAFIEVWNELGDTARACYSDDGYPDTLTCGDVVPSDSSTVRTYSFAWNACSFAPLMYELVNPTDSESVPNRCSARLWLHFYNSALPGCDSVASPDFAIEVVPQVFDTFALRIISPVRVAIDERCKYKVVETETLTVVARRQKHIVVGVHMQNVFTGGSAEQDTVDLVGPVERRYFLDTPRWIYHKLPDTIAVFNVCESRFLPYHAFDAMSMPCSDDLLHLVLRGKWTEADRARVAKCQAENRETDSFPTQK